MQSGAGWPTWLGGLLMALTFATSSVAADQAEQAAASEAVPEWVYLGVERELEATRRQGGLLARELVRQAVLLAVRDELGGLTRDMALDEPRPGNATTGQALQARMHAEPTAVRVQLHNLTDGGEVEPGDPWLALQAELPATELETLSYPALAVQAEQWSRHELPGALRAGGMAGEAHAWHEAGDIAPTITRLLNQFHPFAQYEAVVLAHRAIREQGESPERLAALVRGYAMLGQLTRHHWNASEQVFHARAILYANRLIHKTDASAWAYWHRAYALVLAGLEAWAMADLDAADEADDGTPRQPAWVHHISDFAYGQSASLEIAGEAAGPDADFARYLRFVLAERLRDLDITRRYGKWVLERTPYALRVVDAMADLGGVSNLHRQTQLGPMLLQEATARTLLSFTDLPESARALRPQLADQEWPMPALPDVVRALTAASDPVDCQEEMSWAVLGRLIHEAHFVHVYRRVMFMKFAWSVDVAPIIGPAVRSLVGHRYQPVIEVLGLDTKTRPDEVDAIMTGVDFGDVTLAAQPIFRESWWGQGQGKQTSVQLWKRMQAATDTTSPELSYWLTGWPRSSRDRRLKRADLLRMICPESPVAAATHISLDWEGVQEELPTIELRFANEPTVLLALADQFIKHEMADRAEEALKQYIELTRSLAGYERLAAIYLDRDDEARWLATLEQFLEEGHDNSLRKADVRNDIARHFMADHRYVEAAPYAEAAAQTWAGWAMSTASRCYEGLQDWRQSEGWVQRNSERYTNSTTALQWYWWHVRTGRGNHDAAAVPARQFVDSLGFDAKLSVFRRTNAGLFLLVEGEHEQALKWIRSRYEMPDGKAPWAVMYMLITAHRMGDEALVSEMADLLVEMHENGDFSQPWWTAIAEIGSMLRPSLPPGDAPLPDLAEIDERIASITPDECTEMMICYFVAELLIIAGHPDEARPYFARCTLPTYVGWLDQNMAYWSMRQQGLDPYELLAERFPHE